MNGLEVRKRFWRKTEFRKRREGGVELLSFDSQKSRVTGTTSQSCEDGCTDTDTGTLEPGGRDYRYKFLPRMEA